MNMSQRAVLVGSAVALVALVLTAPRVEVHKETLLTCENEAMANVDGNDSAALAEFDRLLQASPGQSDVPGGMDGPTGRGNRLPAAEPARGRVFACVTDIRTAGTRLVGVLLATGLLFVAFAGRGRGDSAPANDRVL